ncbi:MAG: Na/Pi cotransporter family protein [Candidatus Hydromicrobium sp.]|nr:Na/Pi cotransporter family protein [Candidatus Hydromicrobium sp.]
MYFKLVIEVLGGLALFIFGITRLSDSLQKITSNKLKTVINTLTKKSWSTVLVGLFTTSIIQSSSATSVMAVGFVNAGLLTLRQAIGIIMGANIGTSITAQIVSFKIDMLAYPLIIIGFLMHFLSRRRRYKNIGMTIIGLGLLFLGMVVMKGALEPLKDNEIFKNFLFVFSRNPFFGILAGLALTTLLQSSSATIGLLIALASQGLVPIGVAIPILIGDNIGTCSTALISSIGTTVTAKRTAFSHLLFNIFGTIIFVILLYGFRLEPLIASLTGKSVPHQIANIHTIFNVVTTIILFPMIGLFEKLVIKLYPGKDIIVHKNALYLDSRLIDTPPLSLEQAKKELLRVIKITHTMLNLSFERLYKKDIVIEKKVLDRESAVDSITEDIIRYLTKVSQKSLGLRLSSMLTNLYHIAYDAERAGDHAESILYLMLVKEENNMTFSKIAFQELEAVHDKVNHLFNFLISGMENNNLDKLKQCEKIESEIDLMVKEIRTNHLKRLQNGECMPLSGVVFADIILHLERTGDLLFGISRNLLNIEQY